ncbi:MAG: peptidylprolyl isomerase [Parcubacteria group bacterium]|jgi:hypothetical protein
MTDSEKEKHLKNKLEGKKVKGVTMAISFLVIILIFLAVTEIWVYFLGINNIFVRKVAAIVPYPAAIADNKIISVSSLDKNLEAARKFYESQDFSDVGMRIDFSTPDGKKRLKIKERRILTKMIEDAIIEKEANRRGIKLTDKDVANEVSQKIEQYGSRDLLTENMKNLYGWDIKDFEENIVKPDMYARKLYENMRANDDGFTKAAAKIKQAKAELDKSKDFESVVAKYSEGDSVKDRGDLGWFSSDEMLPEISQAVTGLEKGKTSEIIESSLGYHIIRVEDKKTENNIDKFHIRQIIVRVPTLAQWLSQKEKEIRIFSTMKGYQWNENIGEAQFTNKDLGAFEDNLQKNSADDISVMF